MNIELLQPHTHRGQPCAVGECLDLPETRARWLITRGVAKLVSLPGEAKSVRRDNGALSSSTTQGD